MIDAAPLFSPWFYAFYVFTRSVAGGRRFLSRAGIFVVVCRLLRRERQKRPKEERKRIERERRGGKGVRGGIKARVRERGKQKRGGGVALEKHN